ncbi:MAG: radical SAM protein [Candidatus Methanofastidiosia archaeon]|jgi:uncharacterized Fe-S cluster-containing radical SAM superfamily protein
MYQRFLTPDFEPFDPLELAEKTLELVTRKGEYGLERKYINFYAAPVYRGIATGYAVGCCLRCYYCWSSWSRDFPELYGTYYSPQKAAANLVKAAQKGITTPKWKQYSRLTVEKLRISGCEPTIGKEHLLKLLECVPSEYLFILETNGILLGSDIHYVSKLAEFKEKLYVRVSFKAGTSHGFEERTGAKAEFFEVPFNALRYLLDHGIYAKAAAMTDPRIMPDYEKDILVQKLDEIDPEADYAQTLETERADLYDTTVKRIQALTDPVFAEKLQEYFTSKM